MTPHINARKKDIAKIVILPGDPLRAKLIAEKYLKNSKLINNIRNMLGYTGTYKGKKITVMGHGMGSGSIGIYAYELFAKQFYDVDFIIRIGSCASYDAKIKINDLFIAKEAYGDTQFDKLIGLKVKNRVLKASADSVKLAQKIAMENKIKFFEGRALTSDAFYKAENVNQIKHRTKIDVSEMEAFALYACAQKHHKKALTLLTIVHSNITNESTSAKVREKKLSKMIEWALEIGYEF